MFLKKELMYCLLQGSKLQVRKFKVPQTYAEIQDQYIHAFYSIPNES